MYSKGLLEGITSSWWSYRKRWRWASFLLKVWKNQIDLPRSENIVISWRAMKLAKDIGFPVITSFVYLQLLEMWLLIGGRLKALTKATKYKPIEWSNFESVLRLERWGWRWSEDTMDNCIVVCSENLGAGSNRR